MLAFDTPVAHFAAALDTLSLERERGSTVAGVPGNEVLGEAGHPKRESCLGCHEVG